MTKGFKFTKATTVRKVFCNFKEHDGILPQTLLIPARKVKDIANCDRMARDADLKEWLWEADILAAKDEAVHTSCGCKQCPCSYRT